MYTAKAINNNCIRANLFIFLLWLLFLNFKKKKIDKRKKNKAVICEFAQIEQYLKERNKKINDETKKLWGMNRSLLNNAILGVNSGYEKTLELTGVGYRATLKGKQLNLQLGYSHDINFDIPENIKISVEKQTIIKISGIDKQLVGMVTAKIKTFRPPEPYKGKGIKEAGQYILRKEGKKK